jgi:hypothetical protein
MRTRKLVWDRTNGTYVPAGKSKHVRYLKGPVPLSWLQRALDLPGKSINVGLAIWFKAGTHESRTGITVSNELVEAFGADRHAKYRALVQLEHAGLVKIHRAGKCAPRVTLLKANISSSARDQLA